MINFLLRDKGLTITGAKKIMNSKINQLDDPISSSIKAEYYETKIKLKSKNILNRLKKLNG
jgi:aspartyl/asparaginyl beta-hydroxylase (cupin superfamily)